MRDPLQPERCARLLRAVADPERLRIIQCLRTGPLHVGDLASVLEAEAVNVSHHLQVLRHAGLVEGQKEGRFVLYRLSPEVFPSPALGGMPTHIDFGCCRLEMPDLSPKTLNTRESSFQSGRR
jgi:DNA-binding transcriptional ArsR family regulator